MNMDYEYNLNRHVYLLKKIDLSQQEKFELLDYDIYVKIHLLWEMRFELQSLFEKFFDKTISGEDFSDAIFGMRLRLKKKIDQFRSDLVSGKITNFYPTSNSTDLSTLLSGLFFATDEWEEDEFELPEFHTFVENQFLIFQQILLNEEKIVG